MPEFIPVVILGAGLFLLSCSVAVIGYVVVRYLSIGHNDLEMVPEEIR